MPSPTLQISIQHSVHVRAWYHVLAHFDLGRDSSNCVNPTWVRAAAGQRPPSAAPPQRSFGRFHARYRKAAGRDALYGLGSAFSDPGLFDRALDALSHLLPAPPDVPPMVKRLMAPLADPAGARLVELLTRLVREERAAFLDAWFQRLESPAQGLDSFLHRRLAPLVPVLYGEALQRLLVFPVEALAHRSYHVTPARGVHHLALPATLHNAFFHALVALVRHRTDRLVRPFVPAVIQADPLHPMATQIRVDCGLTTAYHVLLRRAPEEAEPFRDWARGQFALGERQPDAAVAALHPMTLLPDGAAPAVRALLGDDASA